MVTVAKKEVFDFVDADALDELDVSAIAAEVMPKFAIIENKFLAVQFPDKDIIKIPFDVTFDKFEEVMNVSDNAAEQLKALLALLGQGDDSNTLGKKGMLAVVATASRYFTLWERIQGATLGKSVSSAS